MWRVTPPISFIARAMVIYIVPLQPYFSSMGDKSPKANQKNASQKQSKQNSANNKKNQATAAKQSAGQAKKK